MGFTPCPKSLDALSIYMTRPLGKCKLAEMLGFVGVVFVKGAGEYSFAIGC